MSDRTLNLQMPFILPSQAQKHVTHNEALLLLDALVQLSITGEAATPPAGAEAGDRYIVADNATGAWTEHAGEIAILTDGAWAFASPNAGWLAWFEADGALKVFDGQAWQAAGLGSNGTLPSLGIATTPDETNRLAVASPASLFTHAGAGHQLKINKATATDTASLLFQSGWTGHAEIGLAGNTDFSIKVSDGMDWKTGVEIDIAGRVTRPNQPAARAHRTGATFTPTSGQQSGVNSLAVNQGGFALGAAAAGGGNTLVVPATGLYLIALTVSVASASAAYGLAVSRNGSQAVLSVSGSAGAATTLAASGIVQLHEGDTLTFTHSGSATIVAGANGTILSLTMI